MTDRRKERDEWKRTEDERRREDEESERRSDELKEAWRRNRPREKETDRPKRGGPKQ